MKWWHEYRYQVEPTRIDNYGRVTKADNGERGYLVTLKLETELDKQTIQSIIELFCERGLLTNA